VAFATDLVRVCTPSRERTLGCNPAVRGVRHGNYTEADDSARHSVIHSIFVGVTIEGGYTGPGLYTRTDTAVAHRLSRGRQRDNVTGVHRSI
jgi:hypothetical protein